MKKILLALGILITLVLIVTGSYFAVRIFRPKATGLIIDSKPVSSVTINGVEMGQTPFSNKKLSHGEYSIRLEPLEGGYPAFDTKIRLTPDIETVLRREFADSEEYSTTEMISFEPGKKGEAGLSIVTIPANSQIVIDDQVRGFTPYNQSSISPADHKLNISLEGYVDKNLNFKAHQGYKLIVYVVLAKNKAMVASPTPTTAPTWFIQILDTPTGFLRVRKEPSTVSVEVGQVIPGEKFKLIEENSQSGWFKIEYKPGFPGWISNQFAKKVLDNGNLDESLTDTKISTQSSVTN